MIPISVVRIHFIDNTIVWLGDPDSAHGDDGTTYSTPIQFGIVEYKITQHGVNCGADYECLPR